MLWWSRWQNSNSAAEKNGWCKGKNEKPSDKNETRRLLPSSAGTFNCIISLRSCKKVCVVWGWEKSREICYELKTVYAPISMGKNFNLS